MQPQHDSDLSLATTRWCDRAPAAENDVDNPLECVRRIREAVCLRRRWDAEDPRAAERRQLLRQLTAAQNVCHRHLAERLGRGESLGSEFAALVTELLAEDDRYLAEQLADQTLAAESMAFVIKCFRDDLRWLSTLVALLNGGPGVDFLTRVFAEEESIRRSLEAWHESAAESGGHDVMDPRQPAGGIPLGQEKREATDSESVPGVSSLCQGATRLRSAVLQRRVELLLGQPAPDTPDGWFHAWQTASRLAVHVNAKTLPRATPADADSEPIDGAARLQPFRARAAEHWIESLGDVAPQQCAEALRQGVEELIDSAGEVLTFLEDVPLEEAIGGLETLSDDTATCLRGVKRHRRAESNGLRRRLLRCRRVLENELQERRLTSRMEGLFGRRFVAGLERFILALLLAFVVMVIVEGPLMRWEARRAGVESLAPGTSPVEAVFAWMDLGICIVFLSEFALKIGLSRRRLLFLRRYWLTMLLPSIPFGFMAYAAHLSATAETAAGSVLFVRFLRYLRLPRMARWLRVARPIMRGARLVGFLLRASDRLVRRLAPLINRNLVLFERAAIKVDEPAYRTAFSALRERYVYRASEVLAWLPLASRCRLAQARIDDLTVMLEAPHLALVGTGRVDEEPTTREIPLESVVSRLLAVTPTGVSDRIGMGVAESVARWCRALDVFAVRRLPVVRHLAAAGRLPSPQETTARVANRIGVLLRQMLDRIYWFADLYGTVTAPQLVDSIGERLIRATARPTRRLFMLGGLFLVVFYLAGSIPALETFSQTLRRLVATPLVVLGAVCAVPLVIGLWFRRIAGEASEFHTLVAEAQFIAATGQLKRRLSEPLRNELERRVVDPEAAQAVPHQADNARRTVELLWRDYLEGAPFHKTDTKTATQLLGNLALISLRDTKLCYGRNRCKQLRQLDLENARRSIGGPYLWFRFISRSIAQQTAKLVIDYNAHALPVERAASVDITEIHDYIDWLARRLDKPIAKLDLPAEFQRRLADDVEQAERLESVESARRGKGYEVNDFTAIHFLSADAEVQEDIRRRYGRQVAELLAGDRRDNIRRVFRTYPFHHLPREQRTFNPMVLYQQHLAGGRALLLPLKLFVLGLALAGRALAAVWRVVRDVLHPTVGDPAAVTEPDPFAVAVRKIHRMRKPVFMECLQMRAEFDPQYLGVILPGQPPRNGPTRRPEIEDDLAAIGSDKFTLDEFRRLATERRQQVRRFRRWLAEFSWSELSAQSLRAMALAFTINYRNARVYLDATERLRTAFDEASRDPVRALAGGRRWWSPVALCRCLWRGRQIARLFRQSTFGQIDRNTRRLCRRMLCRQGGPLLDALHSLVHRGGPIDPVETARRELELIGRDPSTWSHQLVVLRCVQTLTVMDVETYCRLVAELGEYEGEGLGTRD